MARKITVLWLLQRRRGIEFKASVMVWFLFQKRGENETADIRTEHYGGTTQVRRLKLIYRGSEGGYTG